MYFSEPLDTLAGSDYEIIYADPPWTYNDKMKGHSFSLDHEYQTQDLQWIKSLPVESIAARNAVLFLWAVSPQTPEAFEVMRSWGFKFKTLAFVWSKLTTNGLDVANLGKWTMGNVENCWLGVKGKPSRITRNIRQLVREPRTIHSAKPDEVRNRIVSLMGDIPRIELFARGNINNGWDYWGNEEAGARTASIASGQSTDRTGQDVDRCALSTKKGTARVGTVPGGSHSTKIVTLSSRPAVAAQPFRDRRATSKVAA